MDYQLKRDVVQAIQIDVACTLTVEGQALKIKKGNWLIIKDGKPAEVLTSAQFGKRYEPVDMKQPGMWPPSVPPLIFGSDNTCGYFEGKRLSANNQTVAV